MNEPYDSSWDDDNEELFDQKYEEWRKRDWKSWLEKKLSFPFEARRDEDERWMYYEGCIIDEKKLFSMGHVMTVLGIEAEDDHYGVLVKARERRKTATIVLCDLEVTSREDPNFWPVREYVVWFANR